jgi:putative endonuclease
MEFYVYILRCSDDSFYTGISRDPIAREYQHNSGITKGYTSKRLPVVLVFSEQFSSVYDAISAEKQIKRWSRAKKIALIENNIELLQRLSKSRMHSHGSSGSPRQKLPTSLPRRGRRGIINVIIPA